ncbi:hypothetical protein ACFSHT_07725 [Paraburkholderia silviterrae]
MRPLTRVPPPFGRDWALMPPHFSLRTELQALYAAFLRTVCLSAEAFRQACRWDLHRRFVPEPPRPAAAPVGDTLNAAQAQQAAADTLQHPAAGARAARTAARVERTPPSSHRLAATAIAIGGAVLLTWIVASHTQFGDGKDRTVLHTPASPVSSTDASVSARLSDERAQHDLTMSSAAGNNKDVAAPTTARAASAPAAALQPTATAASNATPSQAPASAPIIITPDALRAPTLAGAPATASPSKPATAVRPDYTGRTHASTPQRATLTPQATLTGDRAAKAANLAKSRQAADAREFTTYKEAGRHPAHDFAPHRSAPLVTTQRTHGMYSEAADYSPLQSSGTSSDDYPSLTTYAGTRTAPPPASRATVNVDNTEWVNHVSQRRVTEVPDSFAK